MPIVGTPYVAPAASGDLITQAALQSALADSDLSAAELAQLPTLAANASSLIRKWCKRHFNRQTYDELYTVDPNSPLMLREFPVNAVVHLWSEPTEVLAVSNTSAAVQRASAALATTGDVASGLVVTGLTLWWVASGVASSRAIAWTSLAPPTLASLAAAIAAVGQGWSATVAAGYESWAVADLRAPQGAQGCADGGEADFVVHVADVPFRLEERTGFVAVGDSPADPWTSTRWGPSLETDWGDQDLRGGFGGYRVVYDAGFDAVPGAVQQACVEAVKAMIERTRTDTTLSSESDGTYSWDARELVLALPAPVQQALSLYMSPMG